MHIIIIACKTTSLVEFHDAATTPTCSQIRMWPISVQNVAGRERTFGLRPMSAAELRVCGKTGGSGITFTTLLAEGGRLLPWLMDTSVPLVRRHL